MPHLSPLKWFNLYIMMITMMMLFMIQMNFLFMFTPSINNQPKKNIKTMKWNI